MVASLHYGTDLVKVLLSVPASVEVKLFSQYPGTFLIDQWSDKFVMDIYELIAATHSTGSDAVKGVRQTTGACTITK